MNLKFYKFAKIAAGSVLRFFYPMKIEGRENVPESGALIVYGNHISMKDPVMVGYALNRPVHFMAKNELFKSKFLSRLFSALGAFPVDRGGADMKAVRTSIRLLSRNEVLGMFPQGGRRSQNANTKLENGVSLIALRSMATLVPVYITGYKLFRKNRLIIGKPIQLEPWSAKHINAEQLGEVTDALSQALWYLNPQHATLESPK